MKNKFQVLILIVFVLFCSIETFAQNKPLIDSLLQVLQKNDSDTNAVNNYCELTVQHEYTNSSQAILYAQKALQLAQKLDYKKGIANAYNNLGGVYSAITQFDSAIYFYELSIQKAHDFQLDATEASVYNNLGIVFYRQGKPDKCLEKFIESNKIWEKLGNKEKIASSYENIGHVYSFLKDYKKAREHYQQAYEINLILNDKSDIARNMMSIASMHHQSDENLQAENLYKEALKLLESIGDEHTMSYLFNNMGWFYEESYNDYAKASEFYEKSIKIREKAQDKRGLARNYSNVGRLQCLLKNYTKSIEYLNKSISITEEYKLLPDAKDAYGELIKTYKEMKNFEKAIVALEKYNLLNDSIFNQQKTQEIAKFQTLYETEKKEREIEKQRLTIIEQNLDLSRRNLLIGSMLGILIVLVLSFLWLYNRYRLKTALQEAQTLRVLQSERERISRELHDNIGSNLTYIISNLDILSHQFSEKASDRASKVSDFARDTMLQLRQTIWSMQQDQFTISELGLKIQEYVQKYLEGIEQLEVQVNFDRNNHNYMLKPTHTLHTFRILQEAVQNTLKYSQASKIEINLNITNSLKNHPTLNFIIQDNGKGFELEKIKEGYGLQNIRKRAKEMNATCEISSKPNQGTRIEVILKVL
jgi:signal transduction histidine kinase